MYRQTLLLLLLPFGKIWAQDAGAEQAPPAVASPYEAEIAQTVAGLKGAVTPGRTQLTTGKENTAQTAIAHFDYFPFDYYRNAGSGAEQGIQHETSRENHVHVNLEIDGRHFEQLTCYQVEDKYQAVYQPTGITYQYDNTSFFYEDPEGKLIASVIYIRKKTGNLGNEQKLVLLHAAGNNEPVISIAPNPVRRSFTLGLQIHTGDDYEVRVLDIQQKPVALLLKKNIQPGNHKYTVPVNLAPGHYLLMLKGSKSKPSFQKLIIE